MTREHVSATEILGLLDEIGFLEKLFWHLPPGILLTAGASTKALGNRFGFPGRHWAINLDEIANLRSLVSYSERNYVYYLADVESDTTSSYVRAHVDELDVGFIDVLQEVYPAWCTQGGGLPGPGQSKSVFGAIVCPQRSASTYLARLLTSTQQMGTVKEHLRHHSVALAKTGAIDLTQWWDSVAKSENSQNGVFATKILSSFLHPLLQLMDNQRRVSFLEYAKHWKLIELRRTDLVGRAVSTYLAQQIGVWHAHNPDQYAYITNRASKVHYNFDELNKIYLDQVAQDQSLNAFIQSVGGADLTLDYAELIHNAHQCALRVVDLLGGRRDLAEERLADTVLPLRPTTTPQNQEFASRFQEELEAELKTTRPEGSRTTLDGEDDFTIQD